MHLGGGWAISPSHGLARTVRPGPCRPGLPNAALFCLVDVCAQPGQEETMIGCSHMLEPIRFFSLHARSCALADEPGPWDTLDSSVPPEPGPGALLACSEPGLPATPTKQRSLLVCRGPGWGQVWATNQAQDFWTAQLSDRSRRWSTMVYVASTIWFALYRVSTRTERWSLDVIHPLHEFNLALFSLCAIRC